jgi:hypothetical protein
LCQSSTGFADPRGMNLCPIHRAFLFLSDGWEPVELHDDFLFLAHNFSRAEKARKTKGS